MDIQERTPREIGVIGLLVLCIGAIGAILTGLVVWPLFAALDLSEAIGVVTGSGDAPLGSQIAAAGVACAVFALIVGALLELTIRWLLSLSVGMSALILITYATSGAGALVSALGHGSFALWVAAVAWVALTTWLVARYGEYVERSASVVADDVPMPTVVLADTGPGEDDGAHAGETHVDVVRITSRVDPPPAPGSALAERNSEDALDPMPASAPAPPAPALDADAAPHDAPVAVDGLAAAAAAIRACVGAWPGCAQTLAAGMKAADLEAIGRVRDTLLGQADALDAAGAAMDAEPDAATDDNARTARRACAALGEATRAVAEAPTVGAMQDAAANLSRTITNARASERLVAFLATQPHM